MEDDDEEIGAAALDEPIDGDDDKDIASQVNLGIEELGSYIYGGGLYSILVVYCFMWSGALESSDVLLSYPLMPLASHLTNILISTLL